MNTEPILGGNSRLPTPTNKKPSALPRMIKPNFITNTLLPDGPRALTVTETGEKRSVNLNKCGLELNNDNSKPIKKTNSFRQKMRLQLQRTNRTPLHSTIKRPKCGALQKKFSKMMPKVEENSNSIDTNIINITDLNLTETPRTIDTDAISFATTQTQTVQTQTGTAVQLRPPCTDSLHLSELEINNIPENHSARFSNNTPNHNNSINTITTNNIGEIVENHAIGDTIRLVEIQNDNRSTDGDLTVSARRRAQRLYRALVRHNIKYLRRIAETRGFQNNWSDTNIRQLHWDKAQFLLLLMTFCWITLFAAIFVSMYCRNETDWFQRYVLFWREPFPPPPKICQVRSLLSRFLEFIKNCLTALERQING